VVLAAAMAATYATSAANQVTLQAIALTAAVVTVVVLVETSATNAANLVTLRINVLVDE
jgi:hypothetical protein